MRTITKLRVEIAGEEQMPSGDAERAEVFHLRDANGDKMNELFQRYFALSPFDRYMGRSPYADRETGQPRVAWALSMGSAFTRDAIVACLRATIRESHLADIAVLKSDDDPTRIYKSPWPATMEIIAMGPSVTDTLAGELCIQTALNQLEAWLSRA